MAASWAKRPRSQEKREQVPKRKAVHHPAIINEIVGMAQNWLVARDSFALLSAAGLKNVVEGYARHTSQSSIPL